MEYKKTTIFEKYNIEPNVEKEKLSNERKEKNKDKQNNNRIKIIRSPVKLCLPNLYFNTKNARRLII